MTHRQDQKIKETFSHDMEMNIVTLKEVTGKNIDLIQRDFVFHISRAVKGVCFYIDGLTDVEKVEKVLRSLVHIAKMKLNDPLEGSPFHTTVVDELRKEVLINSSIKIESKVEPAVESILSGDTVFIIDGSDRVFIVSTKGWEKRSVDEPQTEQVVRGPRDGFTESIRTNTALVRRRIRDPLLRIEGMKIGKKSKTDVNIAYLEGTVKEGLVKETKKRLESIEIDGVIDSGYIEELIDDAPYSPFTTIQSTERPDKVAASILEGRIAVFVDNSPFVLIAPTTFWQFLQASDDYYSRFLSGSFFRVVRYIAFLISLTLPSLYVMLVSFHQEMIPTPLALTIASGREVVPFPVLLEALIMEISFELMREAGLRMPKPVGQAVSIVGSLVIGQAAVQAGLVSPFMVIIIALTGISSFTIPNSAAAVSIRLLRFPLLIAAGSLGLMGFAVMLTFILIHALSLRSFGESYLAPISPFKPSDIKDMMVRSPWWKMDRQPQMAEGEENRTGDNQKPTPPNHGESHGSKEGNGREKPKTGEVESEELFDSKSSYKIRNQRKSKRRRVKK